MSVIFSDYTISSKEAGNAINIELPLPTLQLALKSAIGSLSAGLRLSKRQADGTPVLVMTVTTITGSDRVGKGRFVAGGAGAGAGAGGGAGGAGGGGEDEFEIENLETSLLRREREKIITHEIPCRVLYPETVDSIMEPKVRDPDVNITFPSLLQLKAIADRFTRLSNVTSSSSSTGTSRSSPKLELAANMFGTLRLSVATDSGTVTSEWNGLAVPELNPDGLSGPIEEHPSMKFREAGPQKFATVRVDGKDLSRVLSVGRLDGNVFGSFIDEHAMVLYCYIPHFEDGIGDESVMTVSFLLQGDRMNSVVLGPGGELFWILWADLWF